MEWTDWNSPKLDLLKISFDLKRYLLKTKMFAMPNLFSFAECVPLPTKERKIKIEKLLWLDSQPEEK